MIHYIHTIFRRLFIFLCSVALVACNQDDNPSPANNNLDSVSGFLLNDSGLIIALLTDDEDDETYYFDSWVFTFNAGGTVAATKASETVNGTFSVFRDDGRIELRMNFPNIHNFTELNDDWYFISINQNSIRFDDDGDILEFQRQ